MNLGGGQNTEGSSAGGLFVQFNQDCTSLVAGSSIGYHLYSLSSDDGIEEIYASRTGHETCLVDRLFSSSLVAVVTISAPRKLIVCHYKKGTEICNYSYSNTILAVKLNRARLIVCLEESLHIHNIRDMKILHTIRDTPPNPRGLCCLSPCVDNCYVAYPGSSAVGEVQIFDAIHLNAKCVIPAHESPLAALAFNSTGTRLATASERGTVIRVFGVHERTKLFEFRRGVKRCVAICSLAFSTCGLYLCSASNTETVHVFKLNEANREGHGCGEEGSAGAGGVAGGSAGGCAGSAGGSAGGEAEGGSSGGSGSTSSGWYGWLQSAVSAGATYLPTQVHDVLTQGRAFASARLPVNGVRSACAITSISRSPRVLVATSQGYLYVYALDAAEGGECALLRQHRFLDPNCLHPNTANATTGTGHSTAPRDRESERCAELGAALEQSPAGGRGGAFDLRDERDFPPMRQPID